MVTQKKKKIHRGVDNKTRGGKMDVYDSAYTYNSTFIDKQKKKNNNPKQSASFGPKSGGGQHGGKDSCFEKEVMCALGCIQSSLDGLEIKIKKMEARIMSKISEFAEKQKVHYEKMSLGLDGLVVDIQSLNDKIEEIQNTPGEVTPEDATLLDEIEAAGAALADRVTTLNDLTPPPIPTEPV